MVAAISHMYMNKRNSVKVNEIKPIKNKTRAHPEGTSIL